MTRKTNKYSEDTVEIRPDEFEVMTARNIKEQGENAGFMHSLGRAMQGEKVNNKFLKSQQEKTPKPLKY